MSAEIISLEKMFDEVSCTYFWLATIRLNQLPDTLTLGEYTIKFYPTPREHK